jgi:hypothetical protein
VELWLANPAYTPTLTPRKPALRLDLAKKCVNRAQQAHDKAFKQSAKTAKPVSSRKGK